MLKLPEKYRDCLQEVTNVAMGKAGDMLAKVLDTQVRLSIPHIEIMKPADINMALRAIDEGTSVSGVCQGFIGGGIAGEAMLVFNDTSFSDLAKLMKYDDILNQDAERELLMDTTNVLFGACLKGIGAQIDLEFSFGPPVVLGQHQKISEIFDSREARWNYALVTEINYQIEGCDVNADLLLIMTDDSIGRLFGKLDYLLA